MNLIEFAKFRYDTETNTRIFLEIELKEPDTIWKLDPNGKPLGLPLVREEIPELLLGQVYTTEYIENDDTVSLVHSTIWNESFSINDLKDLKLNEIRQEAEQRILQIAPEFKQRNLTARAVQLIAIYGSVENFPQNISDEWNAGMMVWLSIKEIRDASNAAEEMVSNSSTFEEVLGVNPNWPE